MLLTRMLDCNVGGSSHSDVLMVHSKGLLRESGGKASFLTKGERTWLNYVNVLAFYGNRIERHQIRVFGRGSLQVCRVPHCSSENEKKNKQTKGGLFN